MERSEQSFIMDAFELRKSISAEVASIPAPISFILSDASEVADACEFVLSDISPIAFETFPIKLFISLKLF